MRQTTTNHGEHGEHGERQYRSAPVFPVLPVVGCGLTPYANIGGALGPVLMGVGFDRTGSYQLVLLLCGVATVFAALALLRLGAYPTFSKDE